MNEVSTDCAYFFQIHGYIVDFFFKWTGLCVPILGIMQWSQPWILTSITLRTSELIQDPVSYPRNSQLGMINLKLWVYD